MTSNCMFLFVCVAGAVLVTCQGDPGDSLGDTTLEFTMSVYSRLRDDLGAGENMLLSPFSLNHALLMVYRGARGETAQQIEDAMGFTELDRNWGLEIWNVSNMDSVAEPSLAEVYIANRAFIDEDFDVFQDYVDVLEDEHLSGIESVPFGRDTLTAIDTINTWVEDNTDGQIEELVSEETIYSTTKLVLTNTLYFKAPWFTPFSAQSTTPRPFHTLGSDTPISVPMMSASINALLAQDRHLKCKMLTLPYQDGDYVMTIILPQGPDEIIDLEDGLDATTLRRLFFEVDRRSITPVSVRIPKFQMESSFDFPQTLEELDIVDLFSDLDADLSGVSSEPLYVSALIQKTYIDVDESGTEAAAATFGAMVGRMAMPWLSFHCYHPFLFYIRHLPTESVLFMGRVMDPSAT